MDYRNVFTHSPVALLIEDYSAIRSRIDEIRALGVSDLDAHLKAHPYIIEECMARIEVIEVNDHCLGLYKASDQETLLANLHRVFRDEMKVFFRENLLKMWVNDLRYEAEGVNYALDGSPVYVRLSQRALPGHETDWRRVLVSMTDITERRLAVDALHASRRLARGLFEHSPVSLWVEDFSGIKTYLSELKRRGISNFRRHLAENPKVLTDTMSMIKVIDVNRETLRLFDASDKAALLANLPAVFRDEMQRHWERELVDMWEGKLTESHESVNYALSGRPVDVHVTRSPFPGSEESWDMVLIGLHDITARKKAESYMQYLGTHDALTGLFNRAYFDDHAKRYEVEKNFPFSVVLTDLNGLKQINDTGGHLAGDAILRRAGEVIKKALGDNDIAARMGGDEFAILLPFQDERAAKAFAANLEKLTHLNNTFHSDALLSFSIGYATCYQGGRSVAQAYSVADLAMYEAKRQIYARNGADRRDHRFFPSVEKPASEG